MLVVQHGAHVSFHLTAPTVLGFSRSPPLNSGTASYVRYLSSPFALQPPCFGFREDSSWARSSSNSFVQHFKSGDFGTVCIFGDGSEEGFVEGADDN